MTAPPGQADEIIAGWRERQRAVDHQLHWARLHRSVFVPIRDALIAKDERRDKPFNGMFIVSYADVYWDSQVMAVRRLVDDHKSANSLPRLVLAVRANRCRIPRRWWLDLFLSKLSWRPDDRDWRDAEQQADVYYAGQKVVPESFFVELAAEIVEAGRVVDEHADKHIAHRDRGYDLGMSPVTFAVIHKALDDLERLAGLMHTLLNASGMLYEQVMVPSGWRFPLMEPVFEPPDSVRRWLDETRDAGGADLTGQHPPS